MNGNTLNVGYASSVSQGNYYMPGFDSDYEEKMLFRFRDGLKEQIESLQSDDSPYKDRMKEIEKNLNTLVLFVERQIYEKQVLREKLKEQRKDEYERLLNPQEAARKAERKNFRVLVSMQRKLDEMGRLMAAAKTGGVSSDKYDLIRRAAEISVELKHQIDR